MTDPAITQVLGRDGEGCRECGAPLAADQRYCLNCGRRRGEPRIEFERHLPGVASANGSAPGGMQPAPADPKPQPATAPPQRDYTPLAAVGGIAVLGIMLLIGVLIGKGDGGGSATAPPPVVVQGGEPDASMTGPGKEAGGTRTEAKGPEAKGGDKSGAVKGGSADTGNAPVASDQALEQLQEGTPEEKAERSANLPDEIATGGAPPPEDNKAPGGGSEGTAIE